MVVTLEVVAWHKKSVSESYTWCDWAWRRVSEGSQEAALMQVRTTWNSQWMNWVHCDKKLCWWLALNLALLFRRKYMYLVQIKFIWMACKPLVSSGWNAKEFCYCGVSTCAQNAPFC